jgi:hypothetical protein
MLQKNKEKLVKLGLTLKQDTADDAFQQVYRASLLIFEGDDFRISAFIKLLEGQRELESVGYDVEIKVK